MQLTTADMTTLFERHSAGMLGYFVRRTFDHQVSLDLVGETFAVALENRAKFRGDSLEDARAWLFGIGVNLLNEFFRAGRIERRAMERLQMIRPIADDEDIERIEDLAEIADLRATVGAALDGLDGDHREAVRLRVVDQLDYVEVAGRLGLSESNARMRVSRGLRKLQAIVEASERDGEVR